MAIKRFEDDIPEDVKKRRNNALLSVQGEMTAQLNRELVGQTVDVIVEGESKLVTKPAAYPSSNVTLGAGFKKRGEGVDPSLTQLVGRTRGDQIVVFDGSRSLKGKIVDVQVTDAKQMTLFAKLHEPAAV
ncbi:MAG: TRAM domain-containing protein [Tepidisphaeraceae bacterium]